MSKRDIKNLPLMTRRRLLAALSSAPIALTLGNQGILKAIDLLFSSATAYAAPTPIKYFIEINLRDQWDFSHFVVPPGLATFPNLIRAVYGWKEEARMVGLYQDPSTLIKGAGNIYLTTESSELLPHTDQIAIVDTCEICIGPIHGHEAANGVRSPGRGYKQGSGRLPMWLNDGSSVTVDPMGNEFMYSSSPTPLLQHLNLAQKLNPAARSVVLKFFGRADKKHLAYHFAGNLGDDGLLRVQSLEELTSAFKFSAQQSPLSSAEFDQLSSVLKQIDSSYLKRMKYDSTTIDNHSSHQDTFFNRMTQTQTNIDVNLGPDEVLYWSNGVPDEISSAPRMHLWKQCAYATKLLAADAVSSVGIEFLTEDLHGSRGKGPVTSMGKILGTCLARLIQTLKNKNLWNDTLIMINSLDGGRTPAVDSYGDSGKNTLILAGGRINGGYYGDIRVASTQDNAHTFSYHIFDFATGTVNETGATDNSGRIPDSVAYRSILEAMGATASSYTELPDVGPGQFMSCLLKKTA